MKILLIDRHIIDKDRCRGLSVDLVVISGKAYQMSIYRDPKLTQETIQQVLALCSNGKIVVSNDDFYYKGQYVVSKVLNDHVFNFKTGKIEKK